MNSENIAELHTGWQLAEVPALALHDTIAALSASAWLPATVPGTAHGALLAAGRIPDPFVAMNETAVQWVGERSWAWRTEFDVSSLADCEELVFDGLDTYCTVWLNAELLLQSDNMFVPARIAVRHLLRTGRNTLVLRFDPPLQRAREQEALFGKRHLWNGDSARLYARKAQYHFGWDWGPVLLTSGPWRAVRRHSYAVRIDTLHCQSQVHPVDQVNVNADDAQQHRASLQINTQLAGHFTGAVVQHRVLDPEGHCVASTTCPVDSKGAAQASLSLDAARLWWPRGMGQQPLYTLQTQVLSKDVPLAHDSRRIGLRSLRLVQEPVRNEPGASFYFEVNGQALFCGGANWIPDDNLLERIAPARYQERVAQAAAANMNMLRVWGGGIYEDDAFYDACDAMGILVWQDFLFACGMYPSHAAFYASVRAEARAAVQRLRHRACLAIWCGNNEDYAIAESVGAYGPHAQLGRFDGRTIYETLLPGVCAELDPTRPYWPGSPYSPNATGVTVSSDATVGDRHSWEIWHQQMLPYQRYGDVQARFVSEFGMQSHASVALLESILPPAERFPESRTMTWHNKANAAGAPDGHRRLAVYLADNLRVGTTLADHVYATQFIQAEAMRYAYQDFRRRWQQPGARAVGGALVWQLNDCWPVTSWALIDSAGIVKPAWHSIRRAMATVAVALRMESRSARVAVQNAGLPLAVRLALRVFNLQGQCLHQDLQPLQLPANTSTELCMVLPHFESAVVAEVRVLSEQTDKPTTESTELAQELAQELARDCAWPEPFKHHHLGRAALHFEYTHAKSAPHADKATAVLRIRTDIPVKGLWLQGPGLGFDDNYMDLMPGSTRTVTVQGATTTALAALQWTALEHPAQLVSAPEQESR
jgi:beta-mannosidase